MSDVTLEKGPVNYSQVSKVFALLRLIEWFMILSFDQFHFQFILSGNSFEKGRSLPKQSPGIGILRSCFRRPGEFRTDQTLRKIENK